MTSAGIRYSNMEPDQEMSAEPFPTGVKARPQSEPVQMEGRRLWQSRRSLQGALPRRAGRSSSVSRCRRPRDIRSKKACASYRTRKLKSIPSNMSSARSAISSEALIEGDSASSTTAPWPKQPSIRASSVAVLRSGWIGQGGTKAARYRGDVRRASPASVRKRSHPTGRACSITRHSGPSAARRPIARAMIFRDPGGSQGRKILGVAKMAFSSKLRRLPPRSLCRTRLRPDRSWEMVCAMIGDGASALGDVKMFSPQARYRGAGPKRSGQISTAFAELFRRARRWCGVQRSFGP